MSGFWRIGVSDFQDNMLAQDMNRRFLREQKTAHDANTDWLVKEHENSKEGARLQMRYNTPTVEELMQDRTRYGVQRVHSELFKALPGATFSRHVRKNVFHTLLNDVRNAPTSDSESRYPHKDTEFERRHGDEIGNTLKPASGATSPIVFRVERAFGLDNTVKVTIQSPRNEPLILKYGRDDAHHHPKSQEIRNEAFIDGLAQSDYTFIIGYPSGSTGLQSINLNDDYTRVRYSTVKVVDTSLPGSNRTMSRPRQHRV